MNQTSTLETKLQGATNPLERQPLLLQMAQALAKRDPKRATELAEQAEAIALELGDAPARNAALRIRIDTLYRQASYLEAESTANTLLQASEHPQDRAAAYTVLGHIERSRGRYRGALSYYNSALDVLSSTETALRISALNGLAATHHALSDAPTAAELYLQSLDLSRQSGDRETEGQALSNLGVVYLDQGELQRARELFEQALQLCAGSGNTLREAVARNNLGFTHYRLGDYGRSIELSLEARTLALRIGNPKVEASALGNMALAYAALKYWGKALELNAKALELEHTHQNHATASELLVQIGRIWLEQGHLTAAQIYLQEALLKADSIGYRKSQANAHEALVKLYELEKNDTQALHHYKQFHDLTVLGLREQLEQKTTALLVRFQSEQAHQQAEIFRLRNVELVEANQALHKANDDKNRLLGQLQAQAEELTRLVRTDGLTGLYNRRYLQQQLSLAFDTARSEGKLLSVAMVDIDHFKSVNDTYSHQVGDEVLKAVAKVFKESLPGYELIARYGGEEFVIVFPETSLTQAAQTCERLRQTVESHSWQQVHPQLKATISIGVSSLSDEPNHEKLLHAADEQLYKAKHLGRNRVCYERL
jgi:diguanylate cyclase (GGDEF)-like protein